MIFQSSSTIKGHYESSSPQNKNKKTFILELSVLELILVYFFVVSYQQNINDQVIGGLPSVKLNTKYEARLPQIDTKKA